MTIPTCKLKVYNAIVCHILLLLLYSMSYPTPATQRDLRSLFFDIYFTSFSPLPALYGNLHITSVCILTYN